jgi:3-hydroxyacyl-CoA dehydrogenase
MTSAPIPLIRRVGILGAGVMGRSIAVANLRLGVAVRIYDPNEDAVRGAAKWVNECFPPVDVEFEFADSPSALAGCDLVLEAVVENQSVKRRALAAISELLDPTTLLASNTSSLSITTLGERIAHPERFCGLHFCHPVLDRSLVEVVHGEHTSQDTIERAAAYVEQIGKRPLITADVPGFAVNGLLLPYLDAAIDLVRCGVDWRWLETVAMKAGMPDGPLSRIDDIGVDVILRAAAAFHRGNPTVPAKSEVLLALYQAGRLGRKTGAGFFRYDMPMGAPIFDYAALALVEPYLTMPVECSEAELTRRLFDPLIGTAQRLVDRGVIRSLGEARLALTDGLGCRPPIARLSV